MPNQSREVRLSHFFVALLGNISQVVMARSRATSTGWLLTYFPFGI